MNDRRDIAKVQMALNTTFSTLKDDPWMAQRVLNESNGAVKMKKKLSVGFVLVVLLLLTTMTALAVALSSYFSDFAKLEDTYGEYHQWPTSAKVELVEIMLENQVLVDADVSEWSTLSGTEKELLAEQVLAQHFMGMTYIDTYNAMAHELGSIEHWTEEQRALYTALLEQYGKLTSSWPVYQIPQGNDLTREQAVAQAKDAVLNMFSISAEELETMSVDAIFSVDAYNVYGASKDEPFWIVEFGYGMAYRVYMSRDGEMLGIMGPQTLFIEWERNIMDGSTKATPSEYDADKAQAILQARNALTEIMNVSYSDVDAMDATAYFFYSDLYAYGEEPVWVVIWSEQGKDLWQVLLGYDASFIDVEPAGKIFDCMKRSETSLADLCHERCQMLGIQDSNYNAEGNYYYQWSLEEKVAYYEMWVDFVNQYEASHPYFNGRGTNEWERTRNISGIPNEQAISQQQALSIAQKAIEDSFDMQVKSDDFSIFYYVTNPDRPEWRFATPVFFVVVEAYTGEILMVKDGRGTFNYTVADFLMDIM